MLEHLDEVPAQAIHRGELRGTRRRVGAAVGARRAGLSCYLLPVHVHGDEEELFHVLAGSGLSGQDGRAHANGAGDTILHAAAGAPHTILGAGDGLDVLAFASGPDSGLTCTDIAVFPRSGKLYVRGIEAVFGLEHVDYWEGER